MEQRQQQVQVMVETHTASNDEDDKNLLLIEAGVRPRVESMFADHGINPDEEMQVRRFIEPYVRGVIQACAPDLYKLRSEIEEWMPLNLAVREYLAEQLPEVINNIRDGTARAVRRVVESHARHARLRDAINMLLDSYMRFHPLSQSEALKAMQIEKKNIRPAVERDTPGFKELYDPRRINEWQAALLSLDRREEVQDFFLRGGFVDDFANYEGLHFPLFIRQTERDAIRPERERFQSETLAALVLEVQGCLRAIGWINIPPIKPEKDQGYLWKVEEILKKLPLDDASKEKKRRSFHRGEIYTLEMILSDMQLAALYIMEALHERIAEIDEQRCRILGLKAGQHSLRWGTTYYANDLHVVTEMDGVSLPSEHSGVKICNWASRNFCETDCGFEPLAVEQVNLEDKPTTTIAIGPSSHPDVFEGRRQVHIYTESMRLFSLRSRIHEKILGTRSTLESSGKKKRR